MNETSISRTLKLTSFSSHYVCFHGSIHLTLIFLFSSTTEITYFQYLFHKWISLENLHSSFSQLLFLHQVISSCLLSCFGNDQMKLMFHTVKRALINAINPLNQTSHRSMLFGKGDFTQIYDWCFTPKNHIPPDPWWWQDA